MLIRPKAAPHSVVVNDFVNHLKETIRDEHL
jgi:hypothetical protein